jgi:hypothetical protein
VPAHDVRCNAQQPRLGVCLPEVITCAAVEGPRKRLGGNLVGEISADPTLDETMNGLELALEDDPERLRLSTSAR